MYGEPAPCSYYTAATGFHQTLAPLLTALLGVLMLILVLWTGQSGMVAQLRRMLGSSSK